MGIPTELHLLALSEKAEKPGESATWLWRAMKVAALFTLNNFSVEIGCPRASGQKVAWIAIKLILLRAQPVVIGMKGGVLAEDS